MEGNAAKVAVVEMAGKNVSVTVFESRAAAATHAMVVAKECTEKTVGEIADSLGLRDEFSEGDYRVVLTSIHPPPSPQIDTGS